MAKDRNGCLSKVNGEEEAEEKEKEKEEAPSKRNHGRKSKRKKEDETDDEDDSGAHEGDKKHSRPKKTRSSKRKSRRRHSDEDSSSSSAYSSDSEESDSDSDSESESSDYSTEVSKSEDERRRRKRRERRKRKEREYEKERRRRKREREKEKERKRRKKEKERKKKKKRKEKDGAKKGAVTNSWGKYGIIHETDMWNKRPEFTAWLAEVKQVNLETLPNREEKEMFKQFMEDHNTATFPSKKYYNLDAYHRRKIEKEIKKGPMKAAFLELERTVFNDEEQRRLELLQEREKHKEEQVEVLKRSMQSGMAQAMKEQAQLKEEMAFQYKLGNFEAAAAIQRRLDPDIAM